jgi:peptide-methionine (S)-S-oxide reductase
MSLLPISIGIALLISVVFVRMVFGGAKRLVEPGIVSESENPMAMFGSKRSEPLPAPVRDIVAPESGWEAGERHTAVFAGGCFWGVQSVFQRVRGVESSVVGYVGGSKHTAIYRAVCSMDTGHAEAIEIVFDPAVVTFGTLLRVFFSVVHDPTQLNRQGNDVGTQYRSAIFFTTPEQQEVAQAYIDQLDAAHVFGGRIVTTLTALPEFFAGEEYHQDYALKNPDNPYIQVCDLPKIAELKRQFPEVFQEYTLSA